MKIVADVEIGNRLLPSLNLKAKGKATRTHIAIGRKTTAKDGAVYLMLSTAQNRNGTLYKIVGNIEQVFSKFADDGKATIRFLEPQHDIIVSKADSCQLKSLLNVLRAVAKGEEGLGRSNGACTLQLSTLTPLSTKQVERQKTKLVITSQSDYPVTTSFPSALEELQVLHCKLKRIDSRILALRLLSVLDLSDNCLTVVPIELSRLRCLRSLTLASNAITSLPAKLLLRSADTEGGHCLADTLVHLDLSANQLRSLPEALCSLKALTTLRVAHNALEVLPAHFGHLSGLRTLDAAHNRLRCLPANFVRLSLNTLDLYGNCFASDCSSEILRLGLVTLVEWAARATVHHRLPYKEGVDVPLSVAAYLDSVTWCPCGQPCFQSHAYCLTSVPLANLVKDTWTSLDENGRSSVPLQAHLCSHQCLSRWRGGTLTHFRNRSLAVANILF